MKDYKTMTYKEMWSLGIDYFGFGKHEINAESVKVFLINELGVDENDFTEPNENLLLFLRNFHVESCPKIGNYSAPLS